MPSAPLARAPIRGNLLDLVGALLLTEVGERMGSARHLWPLIIIVALAVGACAARPPVDGRPVEASRADGSLAKGPRSLGSSSPMGRRNDCRTNGCAGVAETCVNVGGCGGPWACVECANAYMEHPVAFCGCDGVTFMANVIGCDTREFAHRGACP